jgi:hypothetical protein
MKEKVREIHMETCILKPLEHYLYWQRSARRTHQKHSLILFQKCMPFFLNVLQKAQKDSICLVFFHQGCSTMCRTLNKKIVTI